MRFHLLPQYVGSRSPEDEALVAHALSVVMDSLPQLSLESLGEAEALLGFVTWAKASATTKRVIIEGEEFVVPPTFPAGLAKTRAQLVKLVEAADTFTKALEAVQKNGIVAGHLQRAGLSINLLAEIDRAADAATIVAAELPKGSHWKKEFSPRRILILGLAGLFEKATGQCAKAAIKRAKDGNEYEGPFFDLVEGVLYEFFRGCPS